MLLLVLGLMVRTSLAYDFALQLPATSEDMQTQLARIEALLSKYGAQTLDKNKAVHGLVIRLPPPESTLVEVHGPIRDAAAGTQLFLVWCRNQSSQAQAEARCRTLQREYTESARSP
jgi:hypothetical protein